MIKIEKENLPSIYTHRLILRKLTETDFQSYYNILKQKEVYQWLGSGKTQYRDNVKKLMKNFEEHWTNHNYGVWAVINKETNELIGHCGLQYLNQFKETELLYAFAPTAWGKGYATEAGRAVIKFAKDNLDISYLIAFVHPLNHGSSNVIEKLGFRYKSNKEFFNKSFLYYQLEIK